jgi:copper oxidase (laccase) domain-containing protein
MIQSDQPTIFADSITAAVSSVDDGNMRFGRDDDTATRANREDFLSQLEIDPLQSTLVQVTYVDNTDFARYRIVSDENLGEGMLEPGSQLHADALVTVRPGHALFLPLADCTGAVLFDPENEVLMVSHLGRHSVEVEGAARSVKFLIDEFGSDPAEILVWLSPAVGPETYPLHAMENRGLHDVIIDQLIFAGVAAGHIEASSVDTADSDNYFSHSEFAAGNRSEDGRFAVAAMMRE